MTPRQDITTPASTPVNERRCGWCEAALTGRDHRARYCDDLCRRAAWGDRHRYGRQDAPEVRSNGLPTATGTRRHARDRDRKRSRRASGPIASDKRIAFSKAVEAGARLMRSVARISEPDALAASAHEMNKALPPSQRGGGNG